MKNSSGRGTVKTSTILIGEGRGFSVYRTLDDVPPRLRTKLMKSTAGANAGTVVIADRRGAQELLRENIRSLMARRAERKRTGFVGLVREDSRRAFEFLLMHRGKAVIGGLAVLAVWWVIALALR